MPSSSTTECVSARQAGRFELAAALQASRARTLALFEAYEAALPPGLPVPFSVELNPPRWEFGHVAWFQEWWLARNRERGLGVACDPESPRPPSRLAGADALYHSGRVAHDSRWQLPLPDVSFTRDYLQAVLSETLGLLAQQEEGDDALYFHRLALFHEDMHAEAAVYMAQTLGVPLPEAVAFPRHSGAAQALPQGELAVAGGDWQLGHAGSGFAFDNELIGHRVTLAAFTIDAAPVIWSHYLPFVEAGGYDEPRWWSAAGWAWRERVGARAPRYLRRQGGEWSQQRFGAWQPLDPQSCAVHLSHFEAEAWCRWAGRRLPGEAEWECAVLTQPAFRWGQVWEWTADTFAPYPGFTPHPYRDYSAPWFGSRIVLRGASAATDARMVHPRYRNYFTPERNDIFAGFRSCAPR